MLFGSDDYILQLASVLSASPFLVDPERRTVPVSATKIRESPDKYWAQIPTAVKPYYQRHICILGPESCGKSTLTEGLARKFHASSVPEYGRHYDQYVRCEQDWNEQHFVDLARGHIAIRTQIANYSGPLIIEDTDFLQTIVWAKYLIGAVPKILTQLQWSPADHYLLLTPDVEWIDDGTRYSGKRGVRSWFFTELLQLLKLHRLPYQIISGHCYRERTNNAIDAVARLRHQAILE